MSYVRWNDIRAAQVERASGEDAIEAGKQELLATVIGHRLAELRRTRGLTQQQGADRTGVTKGRGQQVEQDGEKSRAGWSAAPVVGPDR
ncbi:helix-turn-helix domain-containing protein [Micromonospora echinofusca]|uniref:Helix-turn-helix domain-containing protein n=1 Tax=Micromonospora echinofusca TaxID=47858 RepID=A0ABS3VMR3_MICEH|nr:helix-turn-helix transcriptional regulator [Micromonospora echinofusca]MBO4205846.1 helix-turn-helix domain-containing protein [Micromonospora echinofusca]